MHVNKLTVLLVGEDHSAVAGVQEMLHQAVTGKLRIVHAESAYQIPGTLQSEPFDAAVLVLPETDGIAEAVEALTDCAALPVVVLAPRSNDAAAEALVRQGAEGRLRLETASPLLLKSALRHAIEQRSLRTQLRGVESQLYHAQKMESLGLLAGGIAHDFNNLLVAILGQADMALTDLDDSARVQNCLEAIKRASIRASDLTAQMLAYAGKSSPELKPRNLNRLIEEMSRLLSSSIPRKVNLEMHLAENLPALEMDVTQIRQVVLNLITNAGEAIGNEPGCIRVSTGLSETDPGGEIAQNGGRTWVQLQVADDGCGMDRDTIEKIFEPFFSTKYSGRGLGMSAVQGIVRRHGGHISVQSTPGEGTTFRIALPASSR
ncbi:MAG: ATP-binding protein, partial [Phycisphaerae bacterium]